MGRDLPLPRRSARPVRHNSQRDDEDDALWSELCSACRRSRL